MGLQCTRHLPLIQTWVWKSFFQIRDPLCRCDPWGCSPNQFSSSDQDLTHIRTLTRTHTHAKQIFTILHGASAPPILGDVIVISLYHFLLTLSNNLLSTDIDWVLHVMPTGIRFTGERRFPSCPWGRLLLWIDYIDTMHRKWIIDLECAADC